MTMETIVYISNELKSQNQINRNQFTDAQIRSKVTLLSE